MLQVLDQRSHMRLYRSPLMNQQLDQPYLLKGVIRFLSVRLRHLQKRNTPIPTSRSTTPDTRPAIRPVLLDVILAVEWFKGCEASGTVEVEETVDGVWIKVEGRLVTINVEVLFEQRFTLSL